MIDLRRTAKTSGESCADSFRVGLPGLRSRSDIGDD